MKLVEHIPFQELRRVAFISPHPDDVELCCGILIRRFIHSNIEVHYFCVTDGAPSQEILSAIRRMPIGWLPDHYDRITYKSTRREETIKALDILGVDLHHIKFLDYPDLGTLNHIQSIVQDFSTILKSVDAVFCCPFEGGHPDHDICRFALAVAVNLLSYSGSVFEYASYSSRGYQVFLSAFPTPFTIIADTDEELIQQRVAQVFISQKEEARLFKTNMECFRGGNIIFTSDDYLAYDGAPHYEQFAFPGSYVLKKIQEYLELYH
ncbi:MAG: PIG-L family deacetylase [Anaerolineae bacterium]